MGITCHIIDSEQIDAGPVVAQISLPLDYGANFESNDERLLSCFPLLAQLVFKDFLQNGRLVAQPVILETGGYYPPVDQQKMDRLFAASTLDEYFRNES